MNDPTQCDECYGPLNGRITRSQPGKFCSNKCRKRYWQRKEQGGGRRVTSPMRFAPGQQFKLPNGDTVYAHVRLIPVGENPASGKVDYEVALNGVLHAVELKEPRPGGVPGIKATALTVDDLT